ncbi:catechol 1,2-dioxygenase-2 [Elsinoe australis]|uniref:Catechol 1,2-dioxygenase-2 n=1 Tax=Elsinoe australis TaxID=40998 RepID=A0A4U7AZR9_9PEZI|nr:catechol 1,2-dioxygenase-2 [Elsinoe australis]
MASHKYDPNFTKNCIGTTGENASPRTKQIFASMFTHLHDFIREVEITPEEWMTAVHWINRIGQISTPTRNEAHRISDITGVESLITEIANHIASDTGDTPTSSAILGPFWSPNAPFRELGASIIDSPAPGAAVTYMHGIVKDMTTKKPIPGAVVDLWQASTNGKYDFQDTENQKDNNLRGKFKTDENGEYRLVCLRPTAYSLPTDGPSYELLQLLDRHPMRPAHIHMMMTHPDYQTVITQIYPKDDPWLATDTVFAVKDDLVVDFKDYKGEGDVTKELELNLILAPKGKHVAASEPVEQK